MRRILLNPFYAGQTIFGRTKKINGKKIPVPQSQWVTGIGQHKPLWDEATYTAIVTEYERRQEGRSRLKFYALSGLLVCSVCGEQMHRHGKISLNYIYLACDNGKNHAILRYETALQLVADKVTEGLQNYTPSQRDVTVETKLEIDDLQQRRIKIQEGFEANLYTAAEASACIVTIETEIQRAFTSHARQQQQTQTRAALLKYINTDITSMREFILQGEGTQINRFLRVLIQKITIDPEHELIIDWR